MIRSFELSPASAHEQSEIAVISALAHYSLRPSTETQQMVNTAADRSTDAFSDRIDSQLIGLTTQESATDTYAQVVARTITQTRTNRARELGIHIPEYDVDMAIMQTEAEVIEDIIIQNLLINRRGSRNYKLATYALGAHIDSLFEDIGQVVVIANKPQRRFMSAVLNAFR